MRVAAITVAVLALLGAAAAASGGRSGGDGSIAFQRAVGDVNEYEIWLVRPDGSGLRRLTTAQPAGADTSPAFSPDGSTIVFTRQVRTNSPGASLYVVPSRGGEARRLTTCRPPRCWGDGEARFSRDGSRITFVRAERASFHGQLRRYSVFVVNADGSGLRRLSRTPRWTGDHAPEWSPSGTAVIFVRNGGPFSDPTGDLVSVDARSRVETVLPALPRWARRPTSLAFSPDGRRLLVGFECTATVCGGTDAHPTRLGIARRDGTGLRTVSRSLVADNATWSPSGASIVARCDGIRLCTVRRDGLAVRRFPWDVRSGRGNTDPRFAGSGGSSWGPADRRQP